MAHQSSFVTTFYKSYNSQHLQFSTSDPRNKTCVVHEKVHVILKCVCKCVKVSLCNGQFVFYKSCSSKQLKICCSTSDQDDEGLRQKHPPHSFPIKIPMLDSSEGEMNLLQKWFASISHETCLSKHIYEPEIACNQIY